MYVPIVTVLTGYLQKLLVQPLHSKDYYYNPFCILSVSVCVRHLLLLLLPPFESPAPPAAAAAEAAWLGGLSDWLSLVICVHSSHLHAFQICHFHFVHDGLRVKWEQVRWQHTALSHSSLSILIQPLLSSPILTTALCPQYRLVVIITLMKAVRILLSTPT